MPITSDGHCQTGTHDQSAAAALRSNARLDFDSWLSIPLAEGARWKNCGILARAVANMPMHPCGRSCGFVELPVARVPVLLARQFAVPGTPPLTSPLAARSRRVEKKK